MDISKAELASAAAATAGKNFPEPEELKGADILVRALQAEGVDYLWGYRAARLSTSTTPSTVRKPSATCWCAMSRLPCMPPTALHVPPAKSVSAW